MQTARMVLAAAVVLTSASAAQASVLWRGDFETGDISQWSKAQEVAPERLQIVTNPVAPGSQYALKATVIQGDNPIGASGNRNELVYLSYEPSGTERYYRWQTMFAEDYPSADTWQLFTQWHHSGDSGSPPVEFTIRNEEIALGITSNAVWRAPLVRGVWHDFVFHVKWSSDPSEGFIELWYDGQRVIPKSYMATQFPGMTQYLKQGLYRNNTISQTGVVYHDGFVIGETLEDVVPPAGGTGDQQQHGTNTNAATQGPSGEPMPHVGCSAGSGAAVPFAALLALGAPAFSRLLRRRSKARAA